MAKLFIFSTIDSTIPKTNKDAATEAIDATDIPLFLHRLLVPSEIL